MRNTFRDGWFLTQENAVLQFHSAYAKSSEIEIYGRVLQEKSDFFAYPFTSSVIHVFKGLLKNLTMTEKPFQCKRLAAVCTDNSEVIVIPLLHTLN